MLYGYQKRFNFVYNLILDINKIKMKIAFRYFYFRMKFKYYKNQFGITLTQRIHSKMDEAIKPKRDCNYKGCWPRKETETLTKQR